MSKAGRQRRRRTSSGASPRLRAARALLWALCLASATASIFGPWDSFPSSETSEARIKLAVSVAVCALVGLELLASRGRLDGRGTWRVWSAAFLALLAHFNFGSFHGDRFHHDWEQYHYSLSAKYFRELGYDGLYAASIAARLESPVEGRVVHPSVRDLRTNQVVSSLGPPSRAFAVAVKERFSAPRWRAFVEDHEHFLRHTTSDHMSQMRLDHGFNAPPSWVFVARVVGARAPFDSAVLDGLGTVDYVLLGLAFGVFAATFGSRTACLALVLFGIGYGGRFFWVGGSLLRHDWLAALLVASAMWRRNRPLGAGLALGYAAAVRLFPLLFALGPTAVLIRRWWTARVTGDTGAQLRARAATLRFLGGLACALVLAVGAGSMVGRGAAAWAEFARTIELHRSTWLTNNVGLDNLLLHDRDTFGRSLVDYSRSEPWTAWQERLDANRQARRVIAWSVKAILLAAFLWGVSGLPADRAFALGTLPVFVVFLTTCYYWQMLVLLPVLMSWPLLLGALLLQPLMWGLHLATEGFEVRYALYSASIGLLLLAFLAALLRRSPSAATDARTSTSP